MYKWALVKKLKMEGLEIKLIASRLITELPRWFQYLPISGVNIGETSKWVVIKN